MLHLARRSLLIQLLSVYLLFVLVVLGGGLAINTVVEQRLRDDVQASDRALAQEVALATSIQLSDDENALIHLSTVLAGAQTPGAVNSALITFKAARSDVDYVYWLDSVGILLAVQPAGNQPADKVVLGTQFEPPGVVQRVLSPGQTGPVFEVGAAVEPTFTPGIIVAEAVRTIGGQVSGIVAVSFSLVELSEPLEKIVQAQHEQGRQFMISTIDNNGELIATPDHTRFLQTVLDELPGTEQALQGQPVSQLAPGPDGQDWLFSAVPVPTANWAVVVQRPASEALAVVTQLHLWLLTAALIFSLGGLLFWLLLLRRVIQPLHTLATEHQALPDSEETIPAHARALATRTDEVGNLAGSLIRLERDGLEKLGELRTLLETSNAVVGSLDPHAVVSQIIREARRLVDVQAAAVLLPDEQGVLRVLASDGHSQRYDDRLSLPPENVSSSAVLALRNGRPVQKLLGPDPLPSLSYDEGFRAVLAIPIISRHAGSVVLLVHRLHPQMFNQNEIDLLLTFANYATLAWEHAVLYERSDERLREVARENEQLYQQASQEKQRLEAIMGSMSDGLVLTGIDGTVLYANLLQYPQTDRGNEEDLVPPLMPAHSTRETPNRSRDFAPGASALIGLSGETLEGRPISVLYEALLTAAVDPEQCAQTLARAESAETTELSIEIRRDGKRRVIHLLLFDVNDEAGQAIGRGLLLRDITRERELDEFKTTLLAAVGHELRTPLAAIKGHASTLLQEDVDWSPADERHFLQTISGEADRLALLVSNLLDLSRQEAGLLLLNRGTARVNELAAKTVERIGQQAARVVVDIPTALPLVYIDSARIEVALRNLLTNALVYSESVVQITAEQRGDEIVVTVSDNGPGIAPDELPHVFERFYRAHQGRQQHSGGTGLGLAICKAFIEAHGCAIWAESSEQGTAISFSLPLVSPNGTVVTQPLREERRNI